MQAYELTTQVDEQGNVHLPKDCKPVFGKKARVILLVEQEEEAPVPAAATLEQFVGRLKDSPSFNNDPVTIQRELRDEWR